MIEDKNFSYSFDESRCETCEGNCCIGESGYIWVDQNEMRNIAKSLCIELDELKQRYLFKVKYRYSIKEKSYKDGLACIFFDEKLKRCGIYKARPNQCKTFPFWSYFKNNIKEVQDECPGIVVR